MWLQQSIFSAIYWLKPKIASRQILEYKGFMVNNLCSMQYIGESTRLFEDRFSEHKGQVAKNLYSVTNIGKSHESLQDRFSEPKGQVANNLYSVQYISYRLLQDRILEHKRYMANNICSMQYIGENSHLKTDSQSTRARWPVQKIGESHRLI